MTAIKSKFLNYVKTQFKYTPYELKLISYVLDCTGYEFSKLIILIIIFYLLGKEKDFLFSFLILIPVRHKSGGLHFNNNIYCFIATLLFFLLAIFSSQVAYHFTLFVLLYIISAVIYYIATPQSSPRRPAPSEILIKKCRIYTLCYILLYPLLYFCISFSLFRVGGNTIIIQAIQLFIAYTISAKGGVTYEKP